MISAIVSAIGGPLSSVISGWLGGSGTWFPLQSAYPATVFPWALSDMQRMVCLDVIISLLFENGLSSKDQVKKLGLAVCEGSDWGFG